MDTHSKVALVWSLIAFEGKIRLATQLGSWTTSTLLIFKDVSTRLCELASNWQRREHATYHSS